MDNILNTTIYFVFILLGILLIKFKAPVSQRAASLYRKIGIDVPELLYEKQFVFVGVLLMIAGFLGATGLLSQI